MRRDYDDDERDYRFDDRYSRRDDRRRGRYDDDYDDYDDYEFRRTRLRDPHRGTLILVLGIVGLVGGLVACLPILCCPFAWLMGAGDLARMRAGTMDFSGYSNTHAGYVLGIIGSVLVLGGIAVFFVALAVGR
jgi:hypothetical protein